MSLTYDSHLHSSFSGDSDTPAEEQVLRAIELGLDGICFTEHEDPDYPPEEEIDFSVDFASYFAEIDRLKQKYRDQLRIGAGMEFGIQPHLAPALDALSGRYPFDFILVSQHILEGKDPYYPSYFEGRSEADCYHEFLQTQYDTLCTLSPDSFDSLGHLDYIVRYGPNRNLYYSYEKYADVIDPLLRYLIAHGKCLEVNTGGIKYGLGQPNPCTGVLRRYRELGGERITVGSDAHQPQHLAYAFPDAAALLQELGFSYYVVYSGRIGREVPIA